MSYPLVLDPTGTARRVPLREALDLAARRHGIRYRKADRPNDAARPARAPGPRRRVYRSDEQQSGQAPAGPVLSHKSSADG